MKSKRICLLIFFVMGLSFAEEACFNLKLPKKSKDFSVATLFLGDLIWPLGVSANFNHILAAHEYYFLESSIGFEFAYSPLIAVPHGLILNLGSKGSSLMLGINGRMVFELNAGIDNWGNYYPPISPIIGFRKNLSDKYTLKIYLNFFVDQRFESYPPLLFFGFNYRL